VTSKEHFLHRNWTLGLLWGASQCQNRSLQDLVLRTSVIHDWEVHPLQPPLDPTHV
jgi:hypothetical protein